MRIAPLCLLLTLAPPPLPPPVRQALDTIRANELKGDLSFLASDALQGRYTPSPGLEVAAEFIAAKFRAAGLEPGGNRDYFQTAEMIDRRLPEVHSVLTVGDLQIPPSSITLDAAAASVQIDAAPALVLAAKDKSKLAGLDLKGKVILVAEADSNNRRASYEFDQAIRSSGAALEISIVSTKRRPSQPRLLFAGDAAASPAIAVRSEELAKLVAAPPGALTVSFAVPAPIDNKVTAKNVIGILRGSDPKLASTAVLLTAHYDHIGTSETAGQMALHSASASADRIYNGANDDGSGAVSVIEIARALAGLKQRPKRSIVFMTFFGEERGELGSRYYGQNPVFPIADTVADLNLEQMGRTDSTAGPEINNASVTGYDYSDVTQFLKRAGLRTGITIYKDNEASDAYFTRSDNDALAEQGVPSHTVCVAFDYPESHGLGDEWQKINYENMAKVDRAMALALLEMANADRPPAWNKQNPKAARFQAIRAHGTQ